MDSLDYFCYIYAYLVDLTSAYQSGIYYYSPGFLWWFYPLKLLTLEQYWIFLGVGMMFLIALLWSYPKFYLIIICYLAFPNHGNIDIWITVILIAWYPNIEKHPLLSGMVLGFCCFKPIVILIVPFYLVKCDWKKFGPGFIALILLNYGYFFWDLPALWAFLQASTLSNHVVGPIFLVPIHYGWFVFHYLHFLQTKSSRIQAVFGFPLIFFEWIMFIYMLWLGYIYMKDPNYDRKININRNNRGHMGKIKKAKKKLLTTRHFMEEIHLKNEIDTHLRNLK